MDIMTSQLPVVIIGAGGHGRAALDVAQSIGLMVCAFVDEAHDGETILGVPVVATFGDMALPTDFDYFVALGDNALRQKVAKKTRKELVGKQHASLVHASAYLSPFSSIGAGSIIMGQAFVGPNCKIGEGCIVNTGGQIDHDCILHDYASIGPKACLGGHVEIGQRAIIAIGATVKQNLVAGPDALLAAQAYLNEDMSANAVYRGIPAVKAGTRVTGEKYL